MMSRTLALTLAIAALTINLEAQRGGKAPGGNVPNQPPPGGNIPMSAPDMNPMPRTFFLSGKVALDDGTPLTDPAVIQSNCRGMTRTEGYTDAKGHFSFEIGAGQGFQSAGIDQASDSSGAAMANYPGTVSRNSVSANSANRGSLARDLRECELQAVLPGFSSQVVELASHLGDLNVDVGTIMLHRMAQVQGFTVSATSAAAPGKARKEFDRGRDQVKKEKWDDALKSFQKAVELYPKYAVAWFELGQVQLQKNDVPGAQQSFRQSISADPRFISPYEMLAQIAIKQHEWQVVADNTSEILKLNPLNFPQYWLFNSAANYYLKHYEVAEKSALRGLEADPQHKVPKLEHLLGVLLAQRHDYAGAVEHIKNYLRLSPNDSDAQIAQKEMQEFEKMSNQAAR
ncbi:MAG TPA: tetratricopeptide repeat protein [Terriglobales bacterium]|nr:tetratricopeptide repeat protein [Terriglobales bacterium]